jgi:hypothetical protein
VQTGDIDETCLRRGQPDHAEQAVGGPVALDESGRALPSRTVREAGSIIAARPTSSPSTASFGRPGAPRAATATAENVSATA